jgi:hypothetical protein
MNEYNYNKMKQRAIRELNRSNYYERKDSAESIKVIGYTMIGCILLTIIAILSPGIERFWDSLTISSRLIISLIIAAGSLTFLWLVKDKL